MELDQSHKRRPAWGIGERPTTAQPYITLPTYRRGEEDHVRLRNGDGGFQTRGGFERGLLSTARTRRDLQRREGNGYKSIHHKSTIDYRTVRAAARRDPCAPAILPASAPHAA